MGCEADHEILQEFLIEASEILEQLNEELADLEQEPDDHELLNAMFRGFHTIKGGAGFLNIAALIEICHLTEDVFNVLRQGQRIMDTQLMDVVLRVLDVVNDMIQVLRVGEEPQRAAPSLLRQLKELNEPTDYNPEQLLAARGAISARSHEKALISEVRVLPDTLASAQDEEIIELDYSDLMKVLDQREKYEGVSSFGTEERKAAKEDTGSDSAQKDMTETEFEDLLDTIHGEGRFGPVKSKVIQQSPMADERNTVPAAATRPEERSNTRRCAPGVAQSGRSAGSSNIGRPVVKTKKEQPGSGTNVAIKRTAADTTVRVNTELLDDIMNMVGELVLVRNRFCTLNDSLENEAISEAFANLDVVTADLQLAVMKTRMQPIKKLFGRFPRVVRDLARSMNKKVDLDMRGEETDLDKNLVEALADPLIHLVRNAVDHGIEREQEREEQGKPRKGKVILSAAQEGDDIVLSIQDDGKGIDADLLRKKAVEKDMLDEDGAARLDDKDCFNLIFAPGFSTKRQVSDVSGRGVGMDVVKTRIAQLNGTVAIDSKKGKGSTITIRLPLTLAILPTLMIMVGKQPFALPLASVVEIFNLDRRRTNVVNGQLKVRVRDKALPLFYLRNWLATSSMHQSQEDETSKHVVVVNVASMEIGFVVDYLVGQEEVVIKPLGALLHGMQGMAGATITGDGKIALILDVPGLLRKYAQRF